MPQLQHSPHRPSHAVSNRRRSEIAVTKNQFNCKFSRINSFHICASWVLTHDDGDRAACGRRRVARARVSRRSTQLVILTLILFIHSFVFNFVFVILTFRSVHRSSPHSTQSTVRAHNPKCSISFPFEFLSFPVWLWELMVLSPRRVHTQRLLSLFSLRFLQNSRFFFSFSLDLSEVCVYCRDSAATAAAAIAVVLHKTCTKSTVAAGLDRTVATVDRFFESSSNIATRQCVAAFFISCFCFFSSFSFTFRSSRKFLHIFLFEIRPAAEHGSRDLRFVVHMGVWVNRVRCKLWMCVPSLQRLCGACTQIVCECVSVYWVDLHLRERDVCIEYYASAPLTETDGPPSNSSACTAYGPISVANVFAIGKTLHIKKERTANRFKRRTANTLSGKRNRVTQHLGDF